MYAAALAAQTNHMPEVRRHLPSSFTHAHQIHNILQNRCNLDNGFHIIFVYIDRLYNNIAAHSERQGREEQEKINEY